MATDTALSELIKLHDLLDATRPPTDRPVVEPEPWELQAKLHLGNVELALLRIPGDAVYSRVNPTLQLAKEYRWAGPRHFHYIRMMRRMVEDMVSALSAYIRSDELPPPHRFVTEAREYVERRKTAVANAFLMDEPEPGYEPDDAPQFAPPDRRKNRPAPEDPVHRRTFLNAVSCAASSVVLAGAAPAVGSSDVVRLRQQLDTLLALDNQRGGHDTLERAALAGAREVLMLQAKAATQRTQQRLFSLAADYTTTAAWSCVDAGEHDRADAHLDRALQLAGLARTRPQPCACGTRSPCSPTNAGTTSMPSQPAKRPGQLPSPAATPSSRASGTPALPSPRPASPASAKQPCADSAAPLTRRLHRKLDRRQPGPRRLHPRRCAVRDGLTAPPSGGP